MRLPASRMRGCCGIPLQCPTHAAKLLLFDCCCCFSPQEPSAEITAAPVPYLPSWPVTPLFRPLKKQKWALHCLHKSTEGPGWACSEGWDRLFEADLSSLYGVSAEEGRITKISLGANNLEGLYFLLLSIYTSRHGVLVDILGTSSGQLSRE